MSAVVEVGVAGVEVVLLPVLGANRWGGGFVVEALWAGVRTAVALSAVLALAALGSSVVLASPRFADALVSTTARAYRDLPSASAERTVLAAAPYVYAAYLDAARAALGLPAAASTNRAYGWFPPPSENQD